MSLTCPICLDPNQKVIRDKVKGGLNIDVARCGECELDFLETWDDVERVNALYDGDKYIFTMNESKEKIPLKFDEYQQRLKKMMPYLSKEKSVLEIGSGDGRFLNLIKPHVKLVEGVELSPPQVEKVRAEGFTVYDQPIEALENGKQYDIICFFAVLEHVPNVLTFMQALKKFIHKDTMLFIEVPNLHDVIVGGFDIPEYRDFYYRPEHQYYFTPASLRKLLIKAGFECEIDTSQQASLTNHFHWAHLKKGQPSTNHMASVVPPAPTQAASQIDEILDKVDDYYRELLNASNLGDLLSARVWLKA